MTKNSIKKTQKVSFIDFIPCKVGKKSDKKLTSLTKSFFLISNLQCMLILLKIKREVVVTICKK